jgi:hypothetical protein
MGCWVTLVSNLGILAASLKKAELQSFEYFPDVSTTRQYTKLAFLNGTAVLIPSGTAIAASTATGYASNITSSITDGAATLRAPFGPVSDNGVAMRMGSANAGRVTIMRSTDATTWATALNSASTGDYLTSIAYGNVGGTSIWVSPVEGDNDVYRSTDDGVSFSLQGNVLVTEDWAAATRMGSAFAVFANGTAGYYTSQDGITWTGRSLPHRWLARTTNILQQNRFVASSPSKTVVYTPDPQDSGQNTFMFSDDLVNWGTALSPITQRDYPAAIAYGNNYFVYAINANGTIAAYKSTDGSAWTSVTVPSATAITAGNYLDVAYDSVTNGFYIVAGTGTRTNVWRALV